MLGGWLSFTCEAAFINGQIKRLATREVHILGKCPTQIMESDWTDLEQANISRDPVPNAEVHYVPRNQVPGQKGFQSAISDTAERRNRVSLN